VYDNIKGTVPLSIGVQLLRTDRQVVVGIKVRGEQRASLFIS
jgi:hypothetical protein